MKEKDWKAVLERALEGNGLSVEERQGLATWLASVPGAHHLRSKLLNHMFAKAHDLAAGPENRSLLTRLHALVEVLIPDETIRSAQAFFSPGEACRNEIVALFDRARHHVDICVFTITDNQIRDAILAARKRSVALRIISDNEKLHDTGSDIKLLQDRGIPVKIDMGKQHMHHKFAIFDGKTVVTGSYNWTLSAATRNHENIVVLQDRDTVATFHEEFERIWQTLPLYRRHGARQKKHGSREREASD